MNRNSEKSRFRPEPSSGAPLAWTLFESFDHYFFMFPKSVMSEILSRSTFWRATCSYSPYGVNFRDYIRVRLSIMNPLTHNKIFGEENCSTVDYIDIKGTNFANCAQKIFQSSYTMLYLRPRHSRLTKCNFNTSKIEHGCDNGNCVRLLGQYDVCSDPKYRCSEKTTSTTEFWFGAVKANYIGTRTKGTSLMNENSGMVPRPVISMIYFAVLSSLEKASFGS